MYTMEYYSAMKRNAFELVSSNEMDETGAYNIIQSEVSQKEKYQYSMLTHIYGI